MDGKKKEKILARENGEGQVSKGVKMKKTEEDRIR